MKPSCGFPEVIRFSHHSHFVYRIIGDESLIQYQLFWWQIERNRKLIDWKVEIEFE